MLYWLIWGANDPMLTDNHIQASAISDNADNTDQKAESTKSYFRVKVQEINERTLNRKHERKRNRRKNRSPEAKAAEEVFASNSMDGALTMEDVFQRHIASKSATDIDELLPQQSDEKGNQDKYAIQ
jgi:ribosomal protein L23